MSEEVCRLSNLSIFPIATGVRKNHGFQKSKKLTYEKYFTTTMKLFLQFKVISHRVPAHSRNRSRPFINVVQPLITQKQQIWRDRARTHTR